MAEIRHDWTRDEAIDILTLPLDELCSRAKEIHEKHAAADVQKCVLLSVKTGGCPEDCGYCSQSVKYKTPVQAEGLMDVEKVIDAAKNAKSNGASRFCMGAAWRDIPSDKKFDRILEMIEGVAGQGLEVCCTLGMASSEQLEKMKSAGLTAYNHNLDTGPDHYEKVITTRTYQDRINTLKAARTAGVQLCSGGILGMGESVADRAAMLVDLANMNPHPESVPINLLVPIEGTPLEDSDSVEFEEFLRMVAATRILMPASRVRLSAGRNSLSQEQQMRCFDVGANSIFAGDKLLTTPNVEWDQDDAMFKELPKEKHYSQTKPSLSVQPNI